MLRIDIITSLMSRKQKSKEYLRNCFKAKENNKLNDGSFSRIRKHLDLHFFIIIFRNGKVQSLAQR